MIFGATRTAVILLSSFFSRIWRKVNLSRPRPVYASCLFFFISKFQFYVGLLLLFCPLATKAAEAPAPAPYRFTQNQGQWDPRVLYSTELPQGWLFLEKDGLTYNFLERDYFDLESPAGPQQLYQGHAFRLRLVQANPRVRIRPVQKLDGYRNYYIGADPGKWAANVPGYGEVRYEQIFPNIDLRLYTAGANLKYDYLVAPGARISDIRMQYEGDVRLSLQDGRLLVKTAVNELREEKPYAYQVVNGRQEPVGCTFTLQNQTVGFQVTGPYRPELPLVIDPELVFVTYTGSTTGLSANSATADALGNTYSAGQILGTHYPVTTGAYQTVRLGSNVAISKFTATGANLLYATFLGGGTSEYPLAMAVSKQDELVILGSTSSANFPTTPGAFDTQISSIDYFIAKFSGSGQFLLASTLLGGTMAEGSVSSSVPAGLALDQEDNIIVGGQTNSPDFPVKNSFQGVKSLLTDGVVVKLNPGLNNILWSAFLGGNGGDVISDLKVGPASGKIYVTGNTYSPNFPTTPGALGKNLMGIRDGFLTVISPNGSSILASGYVGTNNQDIAQLVALDDQENVYLAGYTSGSYPISANTYGTPGSIGGYFIHKFNSALTETIFTTHLGASTSNVLANPVPTALQVDWCGNIFMTAYALSSCPTSSDALEKSRRNLYLCQLSPNAQALTYGTYFGSLQFNHIHQANHGHITPEGVFHNIECSVDKSFSATPGAYSPARASGNEGIISKFHFMPPNEVKARVEQPPSQCAPYALQFKNTSLVATSFRWDFGDGQSSTEKQPAHTYQRPGIYRVRLIASGNSTCGRKVDTTYVNVTALSPSQVRAGAIGPNYGCVPFSVTFQSTSQNATEFLWSFDQNYISFQPNPTHTFTAPGKYRVRLIAGNQNTCNKTDSTFLDIEVVAPEAVVARAEEPPSACAPYTVQFSNTSRHAATYYWDFNDGTPPSTEPAPVHTFERPGTYQVRLIAYSEISCNPADTLVIPVEVRRDVHVPNIITPNQDGKNDFLVVTNKGSGVRLQVFNRWGTLVYRNDDYNNEWNGGNLTQGTYYYILETPGACEPTRKGWVEIVR